MSFRSSQFYFPQLLPEPSCRSKVVICFRMLFKSELRILLLNSGDPQSSLARFLNSDLQRSPKFTRAPKFIRAPPPTANGLITNQFSGDLHRTSRHQMQVQTPADRKRRSLGRRRLRRACNRPELVGGVPMPASICLGRRAEARTAAWYRGWLVGRHCNAVCRVDELG